MTLQPWFCEACKVSGVADLGELAPVVDLWGALQIISDSHRERESRLPCSPALRPRPRAGMQ